MSVTRVSSDGTWNTNTYSTYATLQGDNVISDSFWRPAYPGKVIAIGNSDGKWTMNYELEPLTGSAYKAWWMDQVTRFFDEKDKKEKESEMKTFKFRVNGKEFSIEDEAQFIGLARVRAVAEVPPGVKLYRQSPKDANKLERVKVGHFHLFPHVQGNSCSSFFTRE